MSKVIGDVPNRPPNPEEPAEHPTLQQAITTKLAQEHEAAIVEQNKQNLFPTQVVPLPSKGLLYPSDNPLSLGYVELKYMTAKEEDILTTESYIKSGVVLDRLFQSLIVSKVNYDDILLGDKNAIMVAARIYGYGEKYETSITTPNGTSQKFTVDLTELKHKEFDVSKIVPGENRFTFKLPVRGNVIEFKLLTNGDQKKIDDFLKKSRRPDGRDQQLTTRLRHMILSVDGETDPAFIRLFIENELLAPDSRALREYIKEVQPDVDMSVEVFDEDTGEPFRGSITLGLDFFWPDLRT
jgi:hypothetical protein